MPASIKKHDAFIFALLITMFVATVVIYIIIPALTERGLINGPDPLKLSALFAIYVTAMAGFLPAFCLASWDLDHGNERRKFRRKVEPLPTHAEKFAKANTQSKPAIALAHSTTSQPEEPHWTLIEPGLPIVGNYRVPFFCDSLAEAA